MNLNEYLDLLKRINRIKILGKPIYDHFVYQEISLWSFFQEHIWSDIKRGPVNLQKAGIRQSSWVKQKTFALRFLSFGISLFGVLYFSVLRRKTLIFTADVVTGPERVDHRIGRVYAFLKKNGIAYGELVHIPIHRKFLANFVRRRRPVFFLEAIDFIFYFFVRLRGGRYFGKISREDVNFDEFSEQERLFVWNIISSYAQRAEGIRFRVAFLAKLFRILGTKKVLLIDDRRYYHEIVLAAKIAHAQSTMFQHGSFTRYYVGQASYGISPERCVAPDFYGVWNEHWRKKLLSLNEIFGAQGRQIVITGKPTATTTHFNFSHRVDDEVCTILVPYETHARKDEIFSYIESFLKCSDMAVMFKLRRDHPMKEQLVQFGLQDLATSGGITVVSDISQENMAKVDVVVGTYSTLLTEMVEAGKPIGILQSSTSESEELIQDGLAEPVGGSDGTIYDQVRRLAATSPDTLKRRAVVLGIHQNIEDFLEARTLTYV